MSSLTFKAGIDGVHFDPKKGAVKITLIGASHVSLDHLTTLGSKDESVQVTLEREQTKIVDVGDPIVLDQKGAGWLKNAARELEESPDSDDEAKLEGEDKDDVGADKED